MSAASTPTPPTDPEMFLSTVEGEISFFRSLMRARPVGIHSTFHVLTIRNAIFRDTRVQVTCEAVQAKLREYYNLDALEALEPEGFTPPGGEPRLLPEPLPDGSEKSLSSHPFFRAEYTLPFGDPFIDALIAERRLATTPSPPSSRGTSPTTPPPASLPSPRPKRKRGRHNSTASRALPDDDSESSALTQEEESDAEGGGAAGGTPRDTEAGSADEEDEDASARGDSPASTQKRRGRGWNLKRAARNRGNPARGGANKKRKRGA